MIDAPAELHAENAYCSDELWLPVAARAQHDEPITEEDLARLEEAKRKAVENIARKFGEHRRDREG